jgi:hypothetical protein
MPASDGAWHKSSRIYPPKPWRGLGVDLNGAAAISVALLCRPHDCSWHLARAVTRSRSCPSAARGCGRRPSRPCRRPCRATHSLSRLERHRRAWASVATILLIAFTSLLRLTASVLTVSVRASNLGPPVSRPDPSASPRGPETCSLRRFGRSGCQC